MWREGGAAFWWSGDQHPGSQEISILVVRKSPWQQGTGGTGWMGWGRLVGRRERRKERSCMKERLKMEEGKKSVPEPTLPVQRKEQRGPEEPSCVS